MVFTKIYHFRMLSTGSKIVRTALYDVINHDAIDKDGSRNFVRAGRPGPLVNTANRICWVRPQIRPIFLFFSFLINFFYNCSFFCFVFILYILYLFSLLPLSSYFLLLASSAARGSAIYVFLA